MYIISNYIYNTIDEENFLCVPILRGPDIRGIRVRLRLQKEIAIINYTGDQWDLKKEQKAFLQFLKLKVIVPAFDEFLLVVLLVHNDGGAETCKSLTENFQLKNS